MDVSSVSNMLVTAHAAVPKQTQEVVEGNRPDGDGDRDDAVSSVTETQKTTAATGTIGSQLDVTA